MAMPPGCSRARRRSPDAAAPAYGWRRGGPFERQCRTTRCWPPKFTHLTTRDDSRRARQHRTACAALPCWISVVVTRRVAWDPAIAAGGTSLQRAA